MRLEPVPWRPLLERTFFAGVLFVVFDLVRHVNVLFAILVAMPSYFLVRYALHCMGGVYRLRDS